MITPKMLDILFGNVQYPVIAILVFVGFKFLVTRLKDKDKIIEQKDSQIADMAAKFQETLKGLIDK